MLNSTKTGTNRSITAKAKVANQLGEKRPLTVNPGDKIAQKPQSIAEKAQQLAVDAPDITGDHIKVPTYFIVEYPDGETKALHHVRDAKKISDVIRQAQLQEDNWSQESKPTVPNFNLSGLILVLALLVLTVPILIGIF